MNAMKKNTFDVARSGFVTDLLLGEVGAGAIYARLDTGSNRPTKTAFWDVYLWLALPFMIQLVGFSLNRQ